MKAKHIESMFTKYKDNRGIILEIKLDDTEMLKIRIAFDKKTRKGFIRHCSFWEDYNIIWGAEGGDIDLYDIRDKGQFQCLGELSK